MIRAEARHMRRSLHTEDNSAGNDPLYGYRPAMNSIVNRLKVGLVQ